MGKHEFVKKIEEMKPILWGRWMNIAKRTGLPYSTISNYARGVASDPDRRVQIIQACEAEIEDMKKVIDEVLT